MIKELVFIGDEFYYKSGTNMSSIYQVNGEMQFSRSDWGRVIVMLQNGETVIIRLARAEEEVFFASMLEDIMLKKVERTKE